MTDDTIIGSHADYDPRDLQFVRSIREGRTPDIGLEKSQLDETWGRILFEAACYGAFFLGCYYIGPILAGVVIDWAIGR